MMATHGKSTSEIMYHPIWHYRSNRKSLAVSIPSNELPQEYNNAFTDIDYGVVKHLECKVSGYIFTFAENVSLTFLSPFRTPEHRY
jgi:hypothetical protein